MSKIFDDCLNDWKEQIDAELKSAVSATGYADSFKTVLDYALFPGGKRLRPVLFLAFHELFSPANEYALAFASGIELMHSYSLIHDDMPCMDNDDVRRDKPTVHRQFGEGMALLAGDALMDMAYGMLYRPTPAGEPSPMCLFPGLCGDTGLIAGQHADLFSDIATLDELLDMDCKKTGALIKLACVCGYVLGRNLGYADCKNIASVLDGAKGHGGITATDDSRVIDYVMAAGFGDAFGCAFQIYDDVSEYIAGEPVGKTSVLSYIDLDQAKRLLNSKLNEAAKTLDMLPGDTRFLRELLDKFVIV